jgi:hypothetical protein
MYEVKKGSESFYYPYLKMLPTPGSVVSWNDHEIALLQDLSMVVKIRTKRSFVKRLYENVVLTLCKKHPVLFPAEEYTFDLFKFAWDTIQARAFGKRLKWSALVPFADFLNHRLVVIFTQYFYPNY